VPVRRLLRMVAAETLMRWALEVLPDGPEKLEFAEFITLSWVGRMARRLQHGDQTP
jgi:hypothetical protein